MKIKTDLTEASAAIRTPSSHAHKDVLKRIFRLNEDETLEDGFEITRSNTSVVSIGTFHAKQSSQYQSFNLSADDSSQYQFTQLSTYSPHKQSSGNNTDIDPEQRIETMKEMCQAFHDQNKHCMQTYSQPNSSGEDMDASSNEEYTAEEEHSNSLPDDENQQFFV
eukprot:CAMPEP_0197025528 /NCGR_PEP_ID=MMETSP1384-20130603/5831_1 /TAXON_ID=29189 /ORGANISM="Ammonia sp." /LENGTH=164 /DNA_ID=CAMNT_0042454065 /DNA_START=173 /DNA_END=667 /DNA_ORIENTATION=-